MVGGIDYTHNAICLQDSKSSTYLLRQLARADTTTMKFTAFLFAAIAVLGVVTGTDQPAVKTPAEALEKIQASTLPDGVTLTGMSEKIDPPASATAVAVKESEVNDGKNEEDDKKKEQFGWGLGGLGGWGSWGGWGGYGPGSCTAAFLAGPTHWATGIDLVLVCTVAGAVWVCPSVVSTTANITSTILQFTVIAAVSVVRRSFCK